MSKPRPQLIPGGGFRMSPTEESVSLTDDSGMMYNLMLGAKEIIREQVERCKVEEDELTCELCAHADTCRAYQWLERMEG